MDESSWPSWSSSVDVGEIESLAFFVPKPEESEEEKRGEDEEGCI